MKNLQKRSGGNILFSIGNTLFILQSNRIWASCWLVMHNIYWLNSHLKSMIYVCISHLLIISSDNCIKWCFQQYFGFFEWNPPSDHFFLVCVDPQNVSKIWKPALSDIWTLPGIVILILPSPSPSLPRPPTTGVMESIPPLHNTESLISAL